MKVVCVKTPNNASNKSEDIIGTILEKTNGINKFQKNFIQHLLILFMGIRGRYNFLDMSRFGKYSEQSYRNNFEKDFDFFKFNVEPTHNQSIWLLMGIFPNKDLLKP